MANLPWYMGEYVEGHHVELCYEHCFSCPFDECTEDLAQSIRCPRKQCELRMLREAGLIPKDKLVAEEVANIFGVHVKNLRTVMKNVGLEAELFHSEFHRRGVRVFDRGDVDAALERQRQQGADDLARVSAERGKTAFQYSQYLTISEAAEVFGRAQRTIRLYCANGYIPGALKHGKNWMIPIGVEEFQVGRELVVKLNGGI